VLSASGRPGEAIFVALLCATVFVVIALVLAMLELYRSRGRTTVVTSVAPPSGALGD
jgi:hypothetical protein